MHPKHSFISNIPSWSLPCHGHLICDRHCMWVTGSLEQLQTVHFGASLNSLDQCELTLTHSHYQRTNRKTK